MKVYGANKNNIIDAMKSGAITIAVYGLGKMGLPLAAVFADCGECHVVSACVWKRGS